jgi:tetratricopeptide (TPR) repeat protein
LTASRIRLFVSTFTFSFAFGLGLCASTVLAESDTLQKAKIERLAAAGRCEEALAAVDELAKSGPLDAASLAVAGQCQLRLERYPDAARSFQAAKALDPSLPQLDLQLGIAQFLAEDIDGAERSLQAARAAGTTGPEIDFYEALIALHRNRDPAGAAAALEGAGRDRPTTLDPAASYYAGLAWRSAEDEERARVALERVVEGHPDTVWAEAARKALEQTQARTAVAVTSRPWATLEVGGEYDSNVAYIGRGLTRPEDLDSDGDFRGVWAADAGYPVARLGDGMVGVRAAYAGSVHVDARDYDLQYPYAGAWFEYPTGERSLFRLEVGAAYGWLGYDPYVLAAPIITPQWYYEHGKWGTTRVHASAARYDFDQGNFDDEDDPDAESDGFCPTGVTRCGPPGRDEKDYRDRDGWGVLAGVEHTLPVNEGKTLLRAGPLVEYYNSEGEEWDGWGVGTEVGVRQALPWQLTLDVAARYMHRPFSNPSSYPDYDDITPGVEYDLEDSDRKDHFVEVDVRLERPITSWMTASIRYDYLKNDSNVPVFDYDRHLVGGYLTFTWQGEPR